MNKNVKGPGHNERSKANLKRFGKEKPAIPGPGRPPLSPEIKAERKEAREILRDAAPAMAARIARIAITAEDDDVAIRACKVGLDKILPNLEEVETHDDRPLQQFTDEQLTQRLAELNARASGACDGIGAPKE